MNVKSYPNKWLDPEQVHVGTRPFKDVIIETQCSWLPCEDFIIFQTFFQCLPYLKQIIIIRDYM